MPCLSMAKGLKLVMKTHVHMDREHIYSWLVKELVLELEVCWYIWNDGEQLEMFDPGK